MRKALLLSTIVAVGGAFAATGAKAQTGSYTFGTAGGEGLYCDGITGGAVTSAGALSAVHNYYACYGVSTYNGAFGGFGGSVKALGKGTWYALTDSPYFEENLQLIYYTKFPVGSKCKKGEWLGFYESVAYGIPYEEFNYGPLDCGYDTAKVGVNHNPSTRDAALKKAGIVKR